MTMALAARIVGEVEAEAVDVALARAQVVGEDAVAMMPIRKLTIAQVAVHEARRHRTSMAIMASNILNLGSEDYHPNSEARSAPTFGSPARNVAGHKRKLDALRPQPQRPVSGSLVAPVIPSFGAPFLPTKPVTTASSSDQPRRQQGSNGLGLTPAADFPTYESSENDDNEDDDPDVDEEALHAELGEKLTFEHNGMVLSLNSTADLLAWQNERRENWPTKARMTEREIERRRIGEERKRLLLAAAKSKTTAPESINRRARAEDKPKRRSQPAKEHVSTQSDMPDATPVSEVDQARLHLREQEKKLAALRSPVTKSQAVLEKAQSEQAEYDRGPASGFAHDLGSSEQPRPVVKHEEESDAASSILSVSSVVSSDSEPDDSDDEAPPEEAPSRRQLMSKDPNRPICRPFAASGHCIDGETCPYRHEPAPHTQKQQSSQISKPPVLDKPADDSDRKSIYQRLVEQQQEEEDRLALQVIKYLGKAGFFSGDDGDGK
ncbi:hypothetical protein LTR42_003433 [Elasticomyces elasticus]|nr:hypothetical protein LTR42_003433 [Elasticomyces elasticus]